MTTSIKRWGNSQGIRLPKHLLDAVKMTTGDEVVIRTEHSRLIIEKAAQTVAHKTIRELFAGFDGEYAPEEIDWGEQIGEEAW